MSDDTRQPSQDALDLDASLKTLRLALGTPLEPIARQAHEALVATIRARKAGPQ